MLYNFRDLGGLKTKCDRKVKSGLIYRSGNLSHIPAETAQTLAEEHGIRVYIDFRSSHDIKSFGAPESMVSRKIEWINIPINTDDPDFQSVHRPEPKDWLQLYHRLFERNAESWLKFLQIFAEAEAPIVYGCLFGKDRTGIASSVLLEALNVSDELIAQDYAETEKNILPLYKRFEDLWDERPLTEEEFHKHFLTTPSSVMTDFLNFIRTQAVIEESKVLLEHLPYATKTKLQARLLE